MLFCHGHCSRDTEHYRRWSVIPAVLARAGYVVVPELVDRAGVFAGGWLISVGDCPWLPPPPSTFFPAGQEAVAV